MREGMNSAPWSKTVNGRRHDEARWVAPRPGGEGKGVGLLNGGDSAGLNVAFESMLRYPGISGRSGFRAISRGSLFQKVASRRVGACVPLRIAGELVG